MPSLSRIATQILLLSALTAVGPAFADPSGHSANGATQGTPSIALKPNDLGTLSLQSIADGLDLGSTGLLLGGLCAAGLLLFRLLQRRVAGSPRVAVPRIVSPPQAVRRDESAEAKNWTPLDQTTTVVEELDNVEAEAEVFLMLGRMDMAIGVLRQYIESHDDAQPQVWMALLDILHREGLRGEFEQLALQIKARFNVALPTWESANERSNELSALEHFPHLLAKIYKQWSRPDCLGYLRSLVRDDRKGGRSGFHQEVFRELLLLISVQEYRATLR